MTEPKNSLIKQYTKLFALDGVTLTVPDEVLDFIVDKAVEFKIGARGLRAICETILMDKMYTVPSTGEKELVINLDYAKERISHLNAARLKEA